MNDVLYERALPDGRTAWVFPLTFGRARIGVGPPESSFLDDQW